MQYQVNRKCGHSETVQLYGSAKDRQSKLSWLASQICHNCAAQVATEANKTTGLAALVGTPKQIAWAEKIRANKVAELDKLSRQVSEAPGSEADRKRLMDAITAVRGKTEASYWIDHRDDSIREMLKEMA